MNEKRRRALEALLTCRTQEEAATVAGVTSKTIRGYLREKDFVEAYQRAHDAIFDEAARAAVRAINPALDVLQEISANKEAPWSARVTASVNLIRCGCELKETNDILKRIGALEDAQQKRH